MAIRRHRQLARVLANIEPLITVPWSIDVFGERLAASRGRAIVLAAWEFPPSEQEPSGMWIPTKKADYVFYAKSASPSRREQIIGHEFGHLLLDHVPALGDAPAELMSAIAPSLSPELTRRFLARNGYDEPHEAQAEDFGTRLAQAGRVKRPPERNDELGRLTDALR